MFEFKVVEKENVLLKEKLTIVRNNLSDATEQITSMNDKITAYELKLEESLGIII